MATIDDKKLINEIIANHGYYYDDPRVDRIVEYTNMAGNITWGVVYITDRNKERYMEETAYVRDPKVIWDRRMDTQ